MILTSYFLTMTLDIGNMNNLFDKAMNLESDYTFIELFRYLSLFKIESWPFALVCLVTAIVFFPMLLGFIEKHMRIGSRSYKGILSRFNYNFLSTLVVMISLLAIYELWALITAGLLYGESVMLGGIACFIVIILTLLLMSALMCYVASLLLLWLPCLQITGYSFMGALSYANQLNTNARGKIFIAVFLPCFVCVLLQFAAIIPSAIAGVEYPVFIVYELIYLIMLLYYSALMFVVCFDTAGEERMDIKKKLY